MEKSNSALAKKEKKAERKKITKADIVGELDIDIMTEPKYCG